MTPYPTIDAVFTWVDDTDPDWQKRKSHCIQKIYAQSIKKQTCFYKKRLPTSTKSGRFRNRDELRYALRSLDLYAPFFRNIYIVTDQQIPSWLNTKHPQIHCVNHDDIFPPHVSRPCFNSNVIQTHLHRIKGLAEKFIVFDDDILLSSPVTPNDFYTPDDHLIFYTDHRRFNYAPYSLVSLLDKYILSNVITSSQYTARLIKDKTGFTYYHRLAHTPHALTKTLMKEISSVFVDSLKNNDSHQFRQSNDIKTICALAQYYAMSQKKAITRNGNDYLDYYTISWFPLSFILTPLRLRAYLKKEQKKLFFSVNDSTPSDHHSMTLKAVQLVLDRLFPKISPYEKSNI